MLSHDRAVAILMFTNNGISQYWEMSSFMENFPVVQENTSMHGDCGETLYVITINCLAVEFQVSEAILN